MNNPFYRQALIDELWSIVVISNSNEEQTVMEIIDETVLTGNWSDDLEIIKKAFEEKLERHNEPETESEPKVEPTEAIEQIVEKLKIGFNYVPEIGVGYCSNEEDLENMKNFVRGGLAAKTSMGSITEPDCSDYDEEDLD